MNKYSSLFSLIKSLSKSEKKHFKQYASLNLGKGQGNYISLFDSIERQTTENEERISKTFRGEIKSLPPTKTYLYNLILESLSTLHSTDSIENEISELLKRVEILYNKSLFENAFDLLKKAKKLAVKYEVSLSQLRIIYWERLLLRDFISPDLKGLDPDEQQANQNEFYKKEGELIEDHKNLFDYQYLSFRFFNIYYNDPTVQKKDTLLKLKKIFSEPLPAYEKNAKNINAKLIIYNIFMIYFQVLGELEKGCEYSQKSFNVFEKYPHLITANKQYYYLLLGNSMILQRKRGAVNDLENLMEKMRALRDMLVIKSNNLTREDVSDIRIFFAALISEISMDLETGKFEAAFSLISEMEQFYKKNEEYIDTIHKISFYDKFVIANFLRQKYSSTLLWTNKLLKLTGENTFAGIYYFSHILKVITYFEMKNPDSMEYHIKRAIQLFEPKGKEKKFELLFLKSIRQTLTINNAKELNAFFLKLKNGLEKILKQEKDNSIIDYFDFISWIESKLEGRSYAEITQAKKQKAFHII